MKGTKWGNVCNYTFFPFVTFTQQLTIHCDTQVMFWFSFCMLGQPLFILLYTHLAYKQYSFFFFK